MRQQVADMKAAWRKGGGDKDNLKIEPFWHCFLNTAPCNEPGWGRV